MTRVFFFLISNFDFDLLVLLAVFELVVIDWFLLLLWFLLIVTFIAFGAYCNYFHVLCLFTLVDFFTLVIFLITCMLMSGQVHSHSLFILTSVTSCHRLCHYVGSLTSRRC